MYLHSYIGNDPIKLKNVLIFEFGPKIEQSAKGQVRIHQQNKMLRSYAPGVREQKLDMQNQTEVKTNYLLNGSLYGYSVIPESIRLLRFRVVAML